MESRYPLADLSTAVQQLAEQDRRLRIERPAAYNLLSRKPWFLLTLALLALTCEWVARKRGGLA